MPHNLLAATGLIVFSFLCNLPLGRWRISVRKFSTSWFLAVHLSVPLIIFLRIKMGLNVWFIPLTLGAAVAGQLVGGGSGESGEDKGQHKQA